MEGSGAGGGEMGGPGSEGGIPQPMDNILLYFTTAGITDSEVGESFTPATTSSPLFSSIPTGGESWLTPPPSTGEGGSGRGLGSPQTPLTLPHWSGPREDEYPSSVFTTPSPPLALPIFTSYPSLSTTLCAANSSKASVQVLNAVPEIVDLDNKFLLDLLSGAFDAEPTEAEQKIGAVIIFHLLGSGLYNQIATLPYYQSIESEWPSFSLALAANYRIISPGSPSPSRLVLLAS
jgi:hypothetical protein